MDLIQHTPLLTPNFPFFLSLRIDPPHQPFISTEYRIKKKKDLVQCKLSLFIGHCSIIIIARRRSRTDWLMVIIGKQIEDDVAYSGVFSSIDIDVVIQRTNTLHN